MLTMTIDKFGRHIHKHVVKRHLMEDDIISDFLKHRKVQEVLERHAKSTTSKHILRLYSDGTLSVTGYYMESSNSKSTVIYTNQFYTGTIINIHYSNKDLVKVTIDRATGQPNSRIQKNTKFRLKYIGGEKPIPKKTEPVFAELLIEGNVN